MAGRSVYCWESCRRTTPLALMRNRRISRRFPFNMAILRFGNESGRNMGPWIANCRIGNKPWRMRRPCRRCRQTIREPQRKPTEEPDILSFCRNAWARTSRPFHKGKARRRSWRCWPPSRFCCTATPPNPISLWARRLRAAIKAGLKNWSVSLSTL